MKISVRGLLPLLLAAMLLGGVAFGEESTITLMGLKTSSAIYLYMDGAPHGWVYAGEFVIKVDDEIESSYCIDLRRYIYMGVPYRAEIIPIPDEPEWNAMAYVVNNYSATDATSGSIMQLALWKLTYGTDWVTTANQAVEQAACELVEEAMGKRVLRAGDDVEFHLDTWSEPTGRIRVLAEIQQDGKPLVGQAIALSASAGTVVSPEGGVGETDEQGRVWADIELNGAALPITIKAEAVSRTVSILDALDEIQTLLRFSVADQVTTAVVDDFEAFPLGDPRSVGFWKHQVECAVTGKGHSHVDAEMLASALPLEAFGCRVETLEELHGALWLKKASMAERAQQHGLALHLNVALGEIGYHTPLDTNGDGEQDTWVYELLQQAETAFSSDDPEQAKNICEWLNLL